MQPSLYLPLLSFLVSGLFALIVMPWLLRLCKAKGLYDLPDDRKVHHNNIPRLGGAVFVPAILLGMSVSVYLLWSVDQGVPAFQPSTFVMAAGVFVIYLIGLLDDLMGLPATLKFAVQFVAALFLPFCGLYVNNFYGLFGLYEVPVWVGYPLTIFLCLLIVNSVNLIDGIDGLASGLSVIALVAFSVLFGRLDVLMYTLLTASLLGALLVFMYFNLFGRAERGTKIFMGDTGSLVLGYALAYLVMKYAMTNNALLPPRPHALFVACTLLLIPIFDLVRVAFTRLLQGKGIFSPDKTHIHHLFLAAGFGMHAALGCILGLQVAFVAFNFLLLYCFSVPSTLILCLDILLFGGIVRALLVKGRRRDLQQG